MSFGQRLSPSARAFSCPHCGSPVILRAVGITVTAVCPACGTGIDTASPELKIIQAAKDADFATPLNIGWRGDLDGVAWEIIGCVAKSVRFTIYRWEEYLLFNPWHGFRFLSQVNGHWTLFKRLNQRVDGIGRHNALTLNGRVYHVFNKDTVVVDAVKGEFYWRIKTGDETYACDYISAPYMLSSEESDDEINISLGRYVSKAEIRRAFPDARLPYASGVGACQPSGVRHVRSTFTVAGLAAAAAIIVHIAVATATPHRALVDVQADYLTPKAPPASASASAPMWGDPTATTSPVPFNDPAIPTTAQTLTTQSFDLPEDASLRVDTSTNLDNRWAAFDLTLVNDTTHQDFDIHQETGRYSGIDDGEAWSEGSNHARSYTPVLPKGRYRLMIDADTDAFDHDASVPFSLEVDRGVTDIWNLWLTLLLLAIYPAWVAWRVWSFESARWSNSDYSPGVAIIDNLEA